MNEKEKLQNIEISDFYSANVEDCVPHKKVTLKAVENYVSCGEVKIRSKPLDELTDLSMYKLRGGCDISG